MDPVNLLNAVNDVPGLFQYREVGRLNDHMLNVLQAEDRTLDFHVHEDSDEMFLVIEGRMQIEFDDGPRDLGPGEFLVVPRGTRHRPVCTSLVKCLLVEKAGTLTADNTGGTY